MSLETTEIHSGIPAIPSPPTFIEGGVAQLIENCVALQDDVKPVMQEFITNALGYAYSAVQRDGPGLESRLLLKTCNNSPEDRAARLLLAQMFRTQGIRPEALVEGAGKSPDFLVRHYPVLIGGRPIGSEIMRLTYVDTEKVKYVIHNDA